MRGSQRRGSRRAGQRSRLGLGLGLGWALGLSVAAGCGPSASGGGTVTPGGNGNVPDGPDPEGRDEGDSIGELEARLDRLSTEQSTKASGSDATFEVCQDLCSLASSICTVKEKLCDVADRHPGEEEYQSLCRKAELECSEAEDSCVACVEARQSREPEAAPPQP